MRRDCRACLTLFDFAAVLAGVIMLTLLTLAAQAQETQPAKDAGLAGLPFDALVTQALRDDRDAVSALAGRVHQRSLSDDECARLIDAALDMHGRARVPETLQSWLHLLTALMGQGKLNTAQEERFLAQVALPELEVRHTVRQGDPLPLRLSWLQRSDQTLNASFTLQAFRIGDDVERTGVDAPLESQPIHADRRDMLRAFAARTDLAGSDVKPALDWVDLPPGEYEVRAIFARRITGQIWTRKPKDARVDWSNTVQLRDRIKVLPADAPVPVRTFDSVQVGRRLKGRFHVQAIRVRQTPQRETELCIARLPTDEGRSWAEIDVGVAFDIVAAAAGSEVRLGRLAAEGRTWTPIDIETPWHEVPWQPATPVTIILRSNPAAALTTAEVFDIWAGELVYEDVYVDRRDQVELLIARLSEHDNQFERAGAARSLGDLGQAATSAAPTLVAAVREDPAPAVVSAAARALTKIGAPADEAVSALLAALERPMLRRSSQTDVIDALGAYGPAASAAIPLLTQRMMEGHVAVRTAAVEALVNMGPAAMSALETALINDELSVRRIASGHLAEMGPPAITALCFGLSQRVTDDAVRHDALEGLVKCGAIALPALVDAVRGDDDRLRAGAIEAGQRIAMNLATNPEPNSVAALEDLLAAMHETGADKRTIEVVTWAVQEAKARVPNAEHAADESAP